MRARHELREDLMEMRIVVPDAPSAAALAERLTTVFGSERISLRDPRGEVGVVIDSEPSAAVPRVLETVVRWFEQARVATVELWLETRSYKLSRWLPVERGGSS
jgi:hypothetical protein